MKSFQEESWRLHDTCKYFLAGEETSESGGCLWRKIDICVVEYAVTQVFCNSDMMPLIA